MKVIVDADGCPVVDEVLQGCRAFHVPCLLVCDTAHEFYRDGAETIVIDKGADSVDLAVANRARPGDVVITQDYGLASLCLGRCRVLHQDGWEYTQDNIDGLLFRRHVAKEVRRSGGRVKGPKKRTSEQNKAFEVCLRKILVEAQTSVQG